MAETNYSETYNCTNMQNIYSVFSTTIAISIELFVFVCIIVYLFSIILLVRMYRIYSQLVDLFLAPSNTNSIEKPLNIIGE